MANGTVKIHAYIESHHKRCVEALQQIALLADTGSDEHQAKFCPNGIGDGIANGWRVAEAMREVAVDTIGALVLQSHGRERELVAGRGAIEAVTYIEKAMRQLQADHPDTPITWPDGVGGTRYQTVEDWVAWHIQGMRDAARSDDGQA